MSFKASYLAILSLCVSVYFSSTADAQSYCSLNAQTSSFEWIAGVAIGSKVNSDNDPATHPGYQDFTSLSAALEKGKAAKFTIEPRFKSSIYSESFTVYIDLNKNGSFSDPGEMLYFGKSTAANPLISGSFQIPFSAVTGRTRMRVIMSYGTPSAQAPCGRFSYGQVEDYSVELLAGCARTDLSVYKTESSLLASSLSAYSSDLGDVNGDSFPDLVTASGTQIGIIAGLAGGKFGGLQRVTLPRGFRCDDIVTAQMDNLNGSEIICRGIFDRQLTLAKLIGNAWSFLPIGTGLPAVNVGTSNRLIAAGDLDNDGDQDLVVTDKSSISSPRIVVLRNQFKESGIISFVIATTLILPDTTFAVRTPLLADFNGDGRLDIAQANGALSTSSPTTRINSKISVFISAPSANGSLSFTPNYYRIEQPVGTSPGIPLRLFARRGNFRQLPDLIIAVGDREPATRYSLYTLRNTNGGFGSSPTPALNTNLFQLTASITATSPIRELYLRDMDNDLIDELIIQGWTDDFANIYKAANGAPYRFDTAVTPFRRLNIFTNGSGNTQSHYSAPLNFANLNADNFLDVVNLNDNYVSSSSRPVYRNVNLSQTNCESVIPPTPTPTATATPAPSPLPSLTPFPSPSPSPAPSVIPSPLPSPTQSSTPSPTPNPGGGYCLPATGYTEIWINTVEFNPISNFSGGYYPPSFEDFTKIELALPRGGQMAGFISGSAGSPQLQTPVKYLIWIDGNQDKSFDANELVYQSPTLSTSTFGSHSLNLTLPPSFLLGKTRMRVRLAPTALSTNSPCDSSAGGQVEDYSVIIGEPGGPALVYDSGYNGSGTARVGNFNLLPYDLKSFAGKPSVLGVISQPSLPGVAGIARFTLDGWTDPSYTGSIPGSTSEPHPGISFLDPNVHTAEHAYFLDGSAVSALAPTATGSEYFLRRSNSNGSPEESFGIGGKVTLPVSVVPDTRVNLIALPNGKILFASVINRNGSLWLAAGRLSANGAPDPSFGSQGISAITPFGSSGTPGYDLLGMKLQKMGSSTYAVIAALVPVGSSRELMLTRFLVDGSGQPDPQFGDGSCTSSCFPLIVPLPGLDPAFAPPTRFAIQDDGKIVFAWRTYQGAPPSGAGLAVKLSRRLASGALDTSFGELGYRSFDLGEDLVTDIVAQPGAKPKIIVALMQSSPGVYGPQNSKLVRLNDDGSFDLGASQSGGPVVKLSENIVGPIYLHIDSQNKILFVGGQEKLNYSSEGGTAVVNRFFYEPPGQ